VCIDLWAAVISLGDIAGITNRIEAIRHRMGELTVEQADIEAAPAKLETQMSGLAKWFGLG
jgi:hypothetical protein